MDRLLIMETVRWGIIGVGDVTERKSGPGFQRAERSELVAVMRRNGERAADFARRHQVPRWYDDADQLINDPGVDAVYIATPPDSHRHYAEQVAAAGKPVYVEKPMATTADECERMIAACEAAGVPLFVAYYRRAMPRFHLVRDLLATGKIGDPRSVVIRNQRPAEPVRAELPWRVVPEISGGGHFVDLASHTLDLLDWLLGPVTDCSGAAANRGGHYPAEDVVTARLRFDDRVDAIGLWCYDAYEEIDEVEIVGTDGSLKFSSFGQEPVRLTNREGVTTMPVPYPDPVQQPLIQAVVDVLTGRSESAPSTGESALRTARVIDQVLAGHRDQISGSN